MNRKCPRCEKDTLYAIPQYGTLVKMSIKCDCGFLWSCCYTDIQDGFKTVSDCYNWLRKKYE